MKLGLGRFKCSGFGRIFEEVQILSLPHGQLTPVAQAVSRVLEDMTT